MIREALYIGATIVGSPDAESYFGPIKVPGNMSKAATIEAYKQKIREAREDHCVIAPTAFAGSVLANDKKYDNACHKAMVGMLASVVVLDQMGTVLYQQKAEAPFTRGKVALPFMNFLTQTFPRQFADSLRHGDTEPQGILFGFNIKSVLRIAAFEILKGNVGAADIDRMRVPVRLWHSVQGVFDPLAVLLPADEQRDMDIYSALRYFGIEAGDLQSSSQVQAITVKALVEAAQLIPLAV